jgi:hypothetical protein
MRKTFPSTQPPPTHFTTADSVYLSLANGKAYEFNNFRWLDIFQPMQSHDMESQLWTFAVCNPCKTWQLLDLLL